MKPLYPNGETPVRVQEKESRLNSILMLNDCVAKRLILKVTLRYGSCNLVKIPSLNNGKCSYIGQFPKRNVK